MSQVDVSRRSFLLWGLLSGGTAALAVPRLVEAACEETAPWIEGPFYLTDPPLVYNTGSALRVSGVVREANSCAVIAGARIERWHCNPFGIYEDYYRCAMVSDSNGLYSFSSIMPGVYAGLERHIHFKFSAPGYNELITQLELPDPTRTTTTFDIYLERT